jgi:fumarylpyruvate hydrolase
MAIPQLPAPSFLTIKGQSARFPVGRMFCIGRNYAAHAAEMNAAAEPIIFMKPASALVVDAAATPYPPDTAELHHEVELVVALAKGGVPVDEASAEALIYGYSVGLDLTRRDVQARAKQKGEPWETAKGFDGSAVIGPVHPLADYPLSEAARISLAVNGTVRQEGCLSELIFTVPRLLIEIARTFALQPCDLIFTGTPSGVGPLVSGDRYTARIDGLDPLEGRVV